MSGNVSLLVNQQIPYMALGLSRVSKLEVCQNLEDQSVEKGDPRKRRRMPLPVTNALAKHSPCHLSQLQPPNFQNSIHPAS